MSGCDDTMPAVAPAAVVAVVSVVAVVAEELEFDAVATVDAVPVVPADWLVVVPAAARQPVIVNIAATLPAPTKRRDLRAGCGRRFLPARGGSPRRGLVGIVMKPMIEALPHNIL